MTNKSYDIRGCSIKKLLYTVFLRNDEFGSTKPLLPPNLRSNTRNTARQKNLKDLEFWYAI